MTTHMRLVGLWCRLPATRCVEPSQKVVLQKSNEFARHRLMTRTFSVKTRRPADVAEGILVGVGNPLLDITIKAEESFLKKYNLEPNDAIIAQSHHLPMFDEMMEKFSPRYRPGGATQNSIRVAQWILGSDKATTFFGCIGDDKAGRILESEARLEGVNVMYMVDKLRATGRCGSVITGEDRSLVAHLGAADYFTHMFLNGPECWKLIEKAQYYYIGGFVFPVCSQSIFDIANHACEHNKTMVMNLSAPFLCQYFADSQFDILPLVDILFGNGVEARKFSKLKGFNTDDVREIAVKTANLPKENTDRARLVVFTQGKKEIVLAKEDHMKVYQVEQVPASEIRDSTACGDAFVGGFLSQLLQGKPLDVCVSCGSYAAHVIIRQWGCTYPPVPQFE